MNTTCNHCGELLNTMLPFCEQCGTMQASNAEYECETHTDRPALGMCVVCYKPVCEACKTTSGKKILCGDSTHQEILRAWSIVYYSESDFEADAIQKNLDAAEIECKVFSLHDHVAVHFISTGRAAVWVRQHEVQKAMTILTDLNLIA
jgi:hypothetical protein